MSILTDNTLPIEMVEQLCDLMEERELAEVEISQGGMSIRVRRALDAAVSTPLSNQASIDASASEQPTIAPPAVAVADDRTIWTGPPGV